jgi:hypothetical protein
VRNVGGFAGCGKTVILGGAALQRSVKQSCFMAALAAEVAASVFP